MNPDMIQFDRRRCDKCKELFYDNELYINSNLDHLCDNCMDSKRGNSDYYKSYKVGLRYKEKQKKQKQKQKIKKLKEKERLENAPKIDTSHVPKTVVNYP